ncbi:MAG: CHAT domain-containing protein [Meiothermus sp.]|nr:CHAT domain-containing protein [Meiothermus sp.]
MATLMGDQLEVVIGDGILEQAASKAKLSPEQKDQTVKALLEAGLLVKVGKDSSQHRFVHLTFQEYALAQEMVLGVSGEERDVSKRLEQALVNYWDKEGLEPTLALATAIAWKKTGNVSKPFEALLNSWSEGKPSAVVQAMHLYAASAIECHKTTMLLQNRLPNHSIAHLKIAQDKQAPRAMLLKLAASQDTDVLRSLAENPSTPVEALLKLAASQDIDVLVRLAGNPSTPVEALLKLADSQDTGVLRRLAENPSTPVEVLLKLAASQNTYVLRRLAENPSTPVEALLKLAESQDTDVLWRLAENPSTPVEKLLKLADRQNNSVLWSLAGNPSFVLEWLLPPEQTAVEEKTVKPWIPALEAEPNVVLFLPSDPSDQDSLQLLRELGRIKRQVGTAKHKDKFDLQIEALTESINISEALQTINPSILHFAGHGSEDGELVVLDEAGNSEFMPLESLVTMIRNVNASRLRCVILNACYTKKKAKKLLEHVPYVIAYRKAFDDRHAIAFAEGFYQALAKFEHDIKTAFEMGQAQIPDLEAQKNLVLLER